MRHPLSIRKFAVAALLAAAAPLAGAQLYKWTDDKGVVNYSNKPPESRPTKGVAVVEDRVSVYTQDPAVLQATQNARERRGLPPVPPAGSNRRPPPAAGMTPGIGASPGPSADPCFGADPNVDCYGYDGSLAFRGRHRAPRLVQPELTPGAIAGNVNAGGGYTPGLSTQAPLGAQSPRVRTPARQSAPMRDLPPR
jgi:hypothetical protein